MSSRTEFTYQTTLMGSQITLKFLQRCDALAQQSFHMVQNFEDKLTVNRIFEGRGKYSELGKINKAAGLKPVRVSADVFSLLKKAQQASLQEESKFNFAMGPIIKAWNIGFAAAHIPSVDKVNYLLNLTAPHYVKLDEEKQSVFLPYKDMRLDLGAIAKGFIADQVKNFLMQKGVVSALINLGGNVHTVGFPQAAISDINGNTQNKSWAIGLRKPFGRSHDLAGVIYVKNKSVVTSGIYERFFLVNYDENLSDKSNLKRSIKAEQAALKSCKNTNTEFYHHIFDPKTGYPLHNDLMSVTVISDNSIDGDIWTSILYGCGLKKGLEVLQKSSLKPRGLEAIFITKDKKIVIPSKVQFEFELMDQSYKVTD